VVFIVIVGIAAIAGFGYYVYRQMGVSTKSSGNLEQEFNNERAQFEGQVPYVELSDMEHGQGTVHHELEKAERTPLKDLRVVVYDPRQNRLVSFGIPFWLLRLGGNKPINLRNSGAGFDTGVRLSITTEDLERRGKGLIINATGRQGERILVWAE
jgi:hypothetical protein